LCFRQGATAEILSDALKENQCESLLSLIVSLTRDGPGVAWRYRLIVWGRAAQACEDINQQCADQNEREECGNVFALLFVVEPSLVAALALSFRQLIPFFKIECHE
jgi:hypothetical protein